jgi:6-pyruvoyltetrahydropterin/6-carboxytetrahydropterin synthase
MVVEFEAASYGGELFEVYRIGVECRFSAAHRLEGHPGRCSRLHGHSWRVQAVFASDETSSGGMVLDFDEAGAALEDAVSLFDHCYLNEVEPFDKVPPTAENVAREVFERLDSRVSDSIRPARLESVTVWESDDAWASYGGE